MPYEIREFSDGALVLSCGDSGQETDLVFASGAMRGDSDLEKQRAILEGIVAMEQRIAELEAAANLYIDNTGHDPECECFGICSDSKCSCGRDALAKLLEASDV